MSKDETTEAIMDLLQGDPWGQASTHAPCPDHAGHSWHKSTGACSCGQAHSLTGYVPVDYPEPEERGAYLRPEEEDETLGPCGCTDYHMSDCPTRTGGNGMTSDDYLAAWERGGYRDDYYDQP